MLNSCKRPPALLNKCENSFFTLFFAFLPDKSVKRELDSNLKCTTLKSRLFDFSSAVLPMKSERGTIAILKPPRPSRPL